MLPALVVAVLVAVAAAALAVVRHRQLVEARAALADARAHADEVVERRDELAGACRRLEEARDRLEQDRDDLERSVRELGDASAERGSALEASRARAGELEVALREATSTIEDHAAALEAAVAEVASLERRLAEREERHRVAPAELAAACWSLLLARVERQWAAGVAATPEERGLATGTAAAQLAEAVGRDLERLREEVGVHADAAVTGTVEADPLATLLATGEALAVLAPHAERVHVELGPEVVVVGEDWSGPAPALDRLGEAVGGTGLLRRLGVSEGRVEVVLGPPPGEVREG